MSSAEIIIKVVAFTKASNWLNWKELFLASVNRKDPKMGLCFDLSKPFSLTKTESGKLVPDENNLAVIRTAYEELLMSMSLQSTDGENAFQIVRMCKDSNEVGNARLAFERLTKRYEPRTTLQRGKWMSDFFPKKCKVDQNPEMFVYEIEHLLTKIHQVEDGKVIIDEKTFMHQILNSLPSVYDSLVEKLQDEVDKDGDEQLTIPVMATQLGFKYQKMNSRKKTQAQSKEEIAFMGVNRQFKGKCNFCRKIGHKAVNCFEKKKKGKEKQGQKRYPKKFVPRCYNCNELGHKSPDCPKPKKNKENGAAMMATKEEVAFIGIGNEWMKVTNKQSI